MSFAALTAGRVVIDWYYVPSGAHLARVKHDAKPTLVAMGTARFSQAGRATIKIKLNAPGTRLLGHPKRLKLTARGTFTAPAQQAVVATRRFTLTR